MKEEKCQSNYHPRKQALAVMKHALYDKNEDDTDHKEGIIELKQINNLLQKQNRELKLKNVDLNRKLLCKELKNE